MTQKRLNGCNLFETTSERFDLAFCGVTVLQLKLRRLTFSNFHKDKNGNLVGEPENVESGPSFEAPVWQVYK